MQQAEYVRQQLPRIDQHARNASQLCNDSDNVPDAVRSCVGEIEREAAEAAAMLAGDQDEQRLADCIDHLEELGDRAMQACRRSDNVDTRVMQAVETVHGAISELKHRLH